jgi:predicted acylesterase/phospholipase RssA
MPSKSELKSIQLAIDNAGSYQEYKEACLLHDQVSGAEEWKSQTVSREYDYKLIRKRVERIKLAMAKADASELMSILHEGIHGNLGNIANPALLHHCKIGTKDLIEDFIEHVCLALDFIYHADEDSVDFYEKLSFFDETAHSFGQSCLMLSGGAGLGFFHCGVIKSLTEHNLLPNVISGASAGAIIAAMVGTRTNEELKVDLSADSIFERFEKWSVWQGFSKKSLFDSTNLENALIDFFGLTTFEEAFQKTGRHVTVTVSPADLHQHSRLLNSRTSPKAIISQSVRASCAIPYMFTPVKLKAKNAAGEVVPYIPNRVFADGSLMADLPFERLARLYGVNHSIVSQTNPVAVPFLPKHDKATRKGLGALAIKHVTNLAKINSIFAFDVLESLTSSNGAKLGIHKVRSLVDQQYVGDINIMPELSIENMKCLLANPTREGIQRLIDDAEKATWPELDVIERSMRISNAFNKRLNALKQRESKILHQKTAKEH